MRPSASLNASLRKAVSKYHAALPGSPAGEYLEADRGLPLTKIDKFRIGFVAEPEVGHEVYRGRLAIPYLRRSVAGDWSIKGMKFRSVPGVPCVKDDTKYLYLPGEKPRLYNTVAAIDNDDEIAITEGELDAITASAFGVPAVGAPGATTWQPHWSEIFYGYETVYALTDGDKAGLKFGTDLSKVLGNVKIIPMDDGEDVNSMVHKYGIKKILERMGK